MNHFAPVAKSCEVRVSGQCECYRYRENEAHLARDQLALKVSLAIVIGSCITLFARINLVQMHDVLLFCTYASYICIKCALGPEHLTAETIIWTTQSSQGSGSTYTIDTQQHLKGVQMSTSVYVWQCQPSMRKLVINFRCHLAVCSILSVRSPSNL